MLIPLQLSLSQVLTFIKTGKLWVYFIPTASVVFVFYFLSGGFDDLDNSTSHFLFSSWDWLMQSFMYFCLYILLSPMYGIISRIVISHFTGTKSHFSFEKLLFEIIRMIVLFLFFLLLKIVIFLPLTLIFWTEESLYSKSIFFIIKSLFWGFAFIDYSLEAEGKSISDSLVFFFQNLIYCIIIGSIFQFITFLSYPGLIIAPIFTAVLATVLYLNIKKIKA